MSPRNFSEIRLSRIAAEPIVNGIGETSDIGEPTWPRYIRITDIRGLDELKTEERMSLRPTLAAKAKVERDDILMAAVGATVGDAYIHQSDAPACFAGYLVRFRADRSLAHPRFIAHWTQSSHYRHQIRSGYVGSTIENFSASKYRAMRIPLPALSVQREISRFLDRETAKIDALIDKQEQLIATLREDRAATISHAVTKGLDPDTNFSPSGIDWISEIPDHWSHSRIGYACNLLTGFPFRSEGFTDDSDELPLLRGLNVGVQSIDWSSVVYWPRSESAELHPYRLQIGDIVVGLDRPFIGAGTRVAQIGAQDVPSLLLQRVLRLRATDEFENRYVAYLLSGQGFVDHLTPMFTGVSVPHISPGQVASFAIPKPPVHEQRKIIDFLDVRCAKIDALIGKSTDMIETLREYRSALITNAVTGKIDVREGV